MQQSATLFLQFHKLSHSIHSRYEQNSTDDKTGLKTEYGGTINIRWSLDFAIKTYGLTINDKYINRVAFKNADLDEIYRMARSLHRKENTTKIIDFKITTE